MEDFRYKICVEFLGCISENDIVKFLKGKVCKEIKLISETEIIVKWKKYIFKLKFKDCKHVVAEKINEEFCGDFKTNLGLIYLLEIFALLHNIIHTEDVEYIRHLSTYISALEQEVPHNDKIFLKEVEKFILKILNKNNKDLGYIFECAIKYLKTEIKYDKRTYNLPIWN